MSLQFAFSALVRILTIIVISGWGSLASVSSSAAEPVLTSAPINVVTEVDENFPLGMTFSAKIPLDKNVEVDAVSLYYRISSDETLNLTTVPQDSVVVDANGVGFSILVDLQRAYVPLGVALTFYWEILADNQVIATTSPEVTRWVDSRFDWAIHATKQVSIYTYDASPDFASWMLEEAQATIDDLEHRYSLNEIDPIAIWIYPNASDFAVTRQANSRESVAGISYPGASLVTAVIRDGDKREYGRVIPHEISHQVLYHATMNPFAFPPLWLDEGLATQYQTGGTDLYAAMVWEAARDGRLFDITSLNVSFPFQPAQATLAYAASWSVIEYIETRYGPEGIARLIEAFAEGFSVEESIFRALSVTPDELNQNWHEWILDHDPR